MRRSGFRFLLCHMISRMIWDCQCFSFPDTCNRDRIFSSCLASYDCSCLRWELLSGCVQWTVCCSDLLKIIEQCWNSDQSPVPPVLSTGFLVWCCKGGWNVLHEWQSHLAKMCSAVNQRWAWKSSSRLVGCCDDELGQLPIMQCMERFLTSTWGCCSSYTSSVFHPAW